MKRSVYWMLLLGALWISVLPSFAFGAEVEIREAVVASAIENRSPVGVAETFPAGTSRVYAFTRIVGMQNPSTVTHVWYYAGRIMAQVELPVRSADWRTWSSKTLVPSWTGEWLVEVVAADGTILHALPFTVK